RRGHSLFADWVLLAERIEADPFCMLSEILRRTPMRRKDFRQGKRDKFAYHPLAVKSTIGPAGMIDGTAYLTLAQQFKVLFTRKVAESDPGEEHEEMMEQPLDTAHLDDFCEILFRALDRMGEDLLPFYLSEPPTAYEKYPRDLLETIQL